MNKYKNRNSLKSPSFSRSILLNSSGFGSKMDTDTKVTTNNLIKPQNFQKKSKIFFQKKSKISKSEKKFKFYHIQEEYKPSAARQLQLRTKSKDKLKNVAKVAKSFHSPLVQKRSLNMSSNIKISRFWELQSINQETDRIQKQAASKIKTSNNYELLENSTEIAQSNKTVFECHKKMQTKDPQSLKKRVKLNQFLKKSFSPLKKIEIQIKGKGNLLKPPDISFGNSVLSSPNTEKPCDDGPFILKRNFNTESSFFGAKREKQHGSNKLFGRAKLHRRNKVKGVKALALIYT